MIAAAVRPVDAVAIEQRGLVDQPGARVRPERLLVNLDRMPLLPELHHACVHWLARDLRHRDTAAARRSRRARAVPRAPGSAPATSASPPVFANGTASDVTIKTVRGRSVSRSFVSPVSPGTITAGADGDTADGGGGSVIGGGSATGAASTADAGAALTVGAAGAAADAVAVAGWRGLELDAGPHDDRRNRLRRALGRRRSVRRGGPGVGG